MPIWRPSKSFPTTVYRLRDVVHTLADAGFPPTTAVLTTAAMGLVGAEDLCLTAEGATVLAASLPLNRIVGPAVPTATQWDQAGTGIARRLSTGDRYFLGAVRSQAARLPGRPGPRWAVLHYALFRAELGATCAGWRHTTRRWSAACWRCTSWPCWPERIARRLSRPIVELRRQVGRIAHGDFQPLPPPPHDDELRDLTCSVNALAGQLDEMQRVVKRSELIDAAGPTQWRAGRHHYAQRRRGAADRRPASSKALPTRRSGKSGHRATATDADRTTPAAISRRWSPGQPPLSHGLRSGSH